MRSQSTTNRYLLNGLLKEPNTLACYLNYVILGFYLALGLYATKLNLFEIGKLSIYWQIYLSASILLPVSVFTLCYYWSLNEYENHPIAKKLQRIAKAEESRSTTTNENIIEEVKWKTIANRINSEFRYVDKFSSGSMYNRVYVTHNWLLRVTMYKLDIVTLSNLQFTLTHANDVKITQEGNVNAQFLSILVKPIDNTQKPFYIIVNALEYKDFKDKVQSPIHEACDVIIRQSLPDQFMDAFMEQVNENRPLKMKREVSLNT